MASEPTTPVRIPKAATGYTPTTQDTDLRSEINSSLLYNGHLVKIQESLLHALNASSTNWPTLIHNHALSILRSGDCNTFPDLMTRVMDDIREDTELVRVAQAQSQGQSNGTGGAGTSSGGGGAGDAGDGKAGSGKKKEGNNGERRGVVVKGSGEGGQSLALPKSVVEEGMRITRECLEAVCEVQV